VHTGLASPSTAYGLPTPFSQPTAEERWARTESLLLVLGAIFYRYSVLGTGLIAILLFVAVVQAPMIVLACGESIERYQTISASVSDWDLPQGRCFFAMCTFASILNLTTLQTFILMPPATSAPPHALGRLFDAIGVCVPCCRQAKGALWPFGREGAMRFTWLALQSIGLYLLASVPSLHDPSGQDIVLYVQQQLHNVGAACAFGVSFLLEGLMCWTMPRGAFMARKVVTALGVTFCVLFIITQDGLGCTGNAPPEQCVPPMGKVTYALESAMCLSLAILFWLTARDADLHGHKSVGLAALAPYVDGVADEASGLEAGESWNPLLRLTMGAQSPWDVSRADSQPASAKLPASGALAAASPTGRTPTRPSAPGSARML
jgi:hypothetical protein